MQTSYEEVFDTFVKTKLTQFYAAIGPFYAARNKDGSSDSLTYFHAHLDRFEAMINLIDINQGLHPSTMTNIAELGSFYPYVSYYFKRKNPLIHIDLYDIIMREHCSPESGVLCTNPNTETYNVDGVRLVNFNLCTDAFPAVSYDLIFLSEVMEHLPTDLFHFEKRVIDILTPGGHLLVTYPLQGNNAKDYGFYLGGYDHTKLNEGHIREFTDETTKLFFKDLTKVAEAIGHYKAYGKIKLVLYKK